MSYREMNPFVGTVTPTHESYKVIQGLQESINDFTVSIERVKDVSPKVLSNSNYTRCVRLLIASAIQKALLQKAQFPLCRAKIPPP